MGYYDGNTVTALWNYAQHFAMSDNSFGTTFGPSTPGALNLVVGQTARRDCRPRFPTTSPTARSSATPIRRATTAPVTKRAQVTMSGTQRRQSAQRARHHLGLVPGRLQARRRGPPAARRSAARRTRTSAASRSTDYIPHHEPFQYYAATANPHHLPPSSVAMIGQHGSGQSPVRPRDFWAAADHGNLPAVSFLKAAKYQDGHAGYSDPLDEQTFLVDTINRLERLARAGARPRSSSPTTTLTAGTTT